MSVLLLTSDVGRSDVGRSDVATSDVLRLVFDVPTSDVADVYTVPRMTMMILIKSATSILPSPLTSAPTLVGAVPTSI